MVLATLGTSSHTVHALQRTNGDSGHSDDSGGGGYMDKKEKEKLHKRREEKRREKKCVCLAQHIIHL